MDKIRTSQDGTGEDSQSVRASDVFKIIAGNKYDMLTIVAAALLLAMAYLYIVPPSYTAQMVVAETGSSTSMSTAMQALSALTGANLAADPNQQRYNNLVDLLESNAVGQVLLKDQDLLHQLFPKEWDPDRRQWHPPSGFMFQLTSLPNRLFFRQAWAPPSAARVSKYLQDNVKVSDYGSNGLEQLTYAAPSPQLAVRLLRETYAAADSLLREQDLKLTTQSVAYLDKKLETETNPANRDALTQLLLEQERNLVLLEAKDVPYAGKIASAPTAPDIPDSPSIPITVLLAAALGIFFGIVWVFLFRRPTLLVWLSKPFRSLRRRANLDRPVRAQQSGS